MDSLHACSRESHSVSRVPTAGKYSTRRCGVGGSITCQRWCLGWLGCTSLGTIISLSVGERSVYRSWWQYIAIEGWNSVYVHQGFANAKAWATAHTWFQCIPRRGEVPGQAYTLSFPKKRYIGVKSRPPPVFFCVFLVVQSPHMRI